MSEMSDTRAIYDGLVSCLAAVNQDVTPISTWDVADTIQTNAASSYRILLPAF